MKQTKWLLAALIVSLGMNIYACTYLLGHHTRQHVATGNLARKQLEAILHTLPHDKQAVIRDSLKEDMEQLRKDLHDAHQDREKLTALMEEPEINKNAANDAFADLRRQTEKAQEDLQRITLKTFDQMTPDERKKAMQHLNIPETKE